MTITSTLNALKVFDVIYTLSGGTDERFMRYYRTMVYGIYEKGFQFSRIGAASAEAVVLLGFILIITLIQFKGEKKCRTPHVTEAEIKKAFVSAINKLPENRGELIENIEIMIKTLCDNTDLRAQQKEIGKELSIPADMTQSCTAENARVALDQEQYNKDCNEIAKSYNSLKKRYDEVTAAIEKNSARKKFLSNFIISLKSQGSLITEFDERLWGSLVEYVTVYAKDNIVFTFKDGTEITA